MFKAAQFTCGWLSASRLSCALPESSYSQGSFATTHEMRFTSLRRVKLLARKNHERRPMSEIYAMRRANGDWFAFEGRGRLRVPLFHSGHDAMMAGLRNFGMLLFDRWRSTLSLLKEMVPPEAKVRWTFAS